MRWIDGHLDLAYIALHGKNIYEKCIEPTKECISIPDIQDSPVQTFFGTICTFPRDGTCGYGCSSDKEGAFQAGVDQLEIYQQLELDGLIAIQHTGCDTKDTLSTLLLMEGADPIRNASDVAWWRKHGVRIVGLTWAIGTRYAGGNSTGGPITAEGIEVIAALDESGIAHDASHLSDVAFEGLVQHAKGKIVASHSNSRTVLGSNEERHLLDDQAKEIFARGGVIGLNLCNQFLSKDFSKERIDATLDDCVQHVLHYCALAGNRRQVALGSDFDGGFSPQYLPTELKHPSQLPNLENALRCAGFNDADMESFTQGAWKSVFAT